MRPVLPGKHRRWPKLAGWILGVPLVAAGAVLAAWAWSTLPSVSGERNLSGLGAEVRILRDPYGVPQIFAETANDAYFALGYVHAQDRLWQMEFTRRLGAGRLAEVLGAPALQTDRFLRTLGLYRQAEAAAARLTPRTRAALESYAAGINAWLASRSASLPPEFALLDYEPGPWRVADSIVWGQLLAYQLSTNWRGELYRAGLIRKLPPEQVAELWPGDPPDSPVTLEAARRTAQLDIDALLAAVPAELKSHSASNAWVLSGSRSKSGAPILANDPHLGFAAPNTWYLARLETPEMSVTGATVPGVPFTILGHNGHVAWGMTSTGGDTQDLFVETVSPDDPARYLAPGGPLPFDAREERIRIKGDKALSLTVRATRHGPVISDVLEDSKGLAGSATVLALASASDGAGSSGVEALAGMPFVRNASEFEAVAADFRAPLVNILFADRQGTIGLITPGLVPLRKAGDGRYPADGASGDFDWTGFVPASAMPRIVNPPAGFLVNANNRLVGPDYPYMIARDWDNPYRAERIHEMLRLADRHSVEDSMREQGDLLSVAARQLLPRMLDATDTAGDGRLGRVKALLAGWDFRMNVEGPEPLIYTAWLRHAVRRIAGDELGDEFSAYWRPRPGFVGYAVGHGKNWCADNRCTRELRQALIDALDEVGARLGDDMDEWRWGDVHMARFEHRIFSQVSIIGRYANLSIPTGGGDNTVGRGMTAGRGDDPYAHIHGAGYKAVYDLGNLANSRFMIAGGQSGNPFSAHYRDMLRLWRDGEYLRLSGSPDDLADAGYKRLVLQPVAK